MAVIAVGLVLTEVAAASGNPLLNRDWMAEASGADIRAAIAAEADPLQRGLNGMTALHRAAENNNLEAIHVLVSEYGADPNLRLTKDFSVPLHFVGMAARDDKARARSGDTARLLIEFGADIEVTTVNGHTPLMMAVMLGNDTLVAALLESGADPLAWDRHDQTTLHRAARHASSEIVEILLDAMNWQEIETLNAARKSPSPYQLALTQNPALGHTPALERLRLMHDGRFEPGSVTATPPELPDCEGHSVTAADTRLSRIAETVLGDPTRWPEIAELNDLTRGKG